MLEALKQIGWLRGAPVTLHLQGYGPICAKLEKHVSKFQSLHHVKFTLGELVINFISAGDGYSPVFRTWETIALKLSAACHAPSLLSLYFLSPLLSSNKAMNTFFKKVDKLLCYKHFLNEESQVNLPMCKHVALCLLQIDYRFLSDPES